MLSIQSVLKQLLIPPFFGKKSFSCTTFSAVQGKKHKICEPVEFSNSEDSLSHQVITLEYLFMMSDGWDEVSNFCEEAGTAFASRPVCSECKRPSKTCWCSHLPTPKVELSTRIRRIVIVQHPKERKRPHQTAIMAARGIANQKCQIHVRSKVKDCDDILQDPNTYILFPNEHSTDVAHLQGCEGPLTLLILDGTWDEAKKLLIRSPALKSLPNIHLNLGEHRSQFVIKTQPNQQCLSTVETVAHSLAIIDNNQSIPSELLKPLHAICKTQLAHGSVIHDDKASKHRGS